MNDLSKVTRLEVISNTTGRDHIALGIENIKISMQDDDRTMKIFVEYKPITKEDLKGLSKAIKKDLKNKGW